MGGNISSVSVYDVQTLQVPARARKWQEYGEMPLIATCGFNKRNPHVIIQTYYVSRKHPVLSMPLSNEGKSIGL